MTEIAIHTENLSCSFKNNVQALDNLCLKVPQGIVFGFLGPNGSGKTTTIQLLLGLLQPTTGRATVLGFDTQSQADEIRCRTGALLEHSGLYERLSAEDNLEFYGRVWRLPPAQRQTRIRELLTGLGLWQRRRERVGTWSRGMKQKLAVARAMLHRPPLIFLDEPTAGLDPIAATALCDDIAEMVTREGVTVFLTTHNLAEAEKLCALIGVIRKGKLLAVGHPDELRARIGSPHVEILGQGFNNRVLELLREQPEVLRAEFQNGRLLIQLHREISVAPLVSLLVQIGVQVEEVHKGKVSLIEAFLKLMEAE
ncbi:MAG: ABC transporter ATP-binding protein [Chroococcidiopsidaceae cyanobacterium CP_BM_ER_R8_30]|nr:ABC transporter ATP-binding protein [Chroococcidiopsidaceae cyanobacterium CP_BM_ER_R8_30]